MSLFSLITSFKEKQSPSISIDIIVYELNVYRLTIYKPKIKYYIFY